MSLISKIGSWFGSFIYLISDSESWCYSCSWIESSLWFYFCSVLWSVAESCCYSCSYPIRKWCWTDLYIISSVYCIYFPPWRSTICWELNGEISSAQCFAFSFLFDVRCWMLALKQDVDVEILSAQCYVYVYSSWRRNSISQPYQVTIGWFSFRTFAWALALYHYIWYYINKGSLLTTNILIKMCIYLYESN